MPGHPWTGSRRLLQDDELTVLEGELAKLDQLSRKPKPKSQRTSRQSGRRRSKSTPGARRTLGTKRDTVKEVERKKVTIKKKGKTRTVNKNVTKLIDEDFTWKAAERTGLSLKDYVIGGINPSFKLKLYHTLRALEEAGLEPGITSAFRDDYRQSLAKGLKAASDRSFHGGSAHGGYGHGLAADLVSVRGATRAERCASSELLWKWIDEHGQEFGVGRPYLDRDPPHVAPIDGTEYAAHHRKDNAKHAALERKKRRRVAARDEHGSAQRAKMARPSRVKLISPHQADSRNWLLRRWPGGA